MKIDHSDQNGYAGIISSCAIALMPSTSTPVQRESWFRTNTPSPTSHSTAPTHSTTQPQVFSDPKM